MSGTVFRNLALARLQSLGFRNLASARFQSLGFRT
jgi:hypothetical protein